jgi:3-isopropylmalate dehydratase small subunit
VPEFEKRCMLEGLDEVEMTLQGEARISEHERKVGRSWRAAPIEAEEVLPVAR